MNFLSFRNKVLDEAKKQKELIQQGQNIPASAKKYTRLSGLIISVATALGFLLLWVLSWNLGTIYVGALLFCAVFFFIGLFELLTGRNVSSFKK